VFVFIDILLFLWIGYLPIYGLCCWYVHL